MIVIRVNILKAITNRLDEVFPNIKVNVNESTQGIEEPCFLVYKVDKSPTRRPMERYNYQAIYNIVYLAEKEVDTFLLEEIEEKLLLEMEYIYLGNSPIRGTVESSIKDDAINVLVEYAYTLRKIKNPDFDFTKPGGDGEGDDNNNNWNPIDPGDYEPPTIKPNPDPTRPTDPDIDNDVDFMKILDHKHEKRGKNGKEEN